MRRSLLTLIAIMAAGCGPLGQPTTKSAAPAVQTPLPLAISLVDVMRASVEIPADGIWAAQGADKLSKEDWLLAEQDAEDLAAAATLISMPGKSAQDSARVANADYQTWAADIQKTALQIRDATKTKDQIKFSAAADHLTETCQACHDKYRPQTPSDGVARYPFYPPRVIDKKSGFEAP